MKSYYREVVEDPKHGEVFILILEDGSYVRVVNEKLSPDEMDKLDQERIKWYPQLTDDDFNNIAISLQRKHLSNNTKKILQEALNYTIEWSRFDFDLFNSATRKRVERVGEIVIKLKNEISDPHFGGFLLEYEYLDILKQIFVAEQKVKSKLKFYRKRQGRMKENLLLLTLIERLAKVYKPITGKNPTLTKTPPTASRINKPGGAFYRFASMFVAIAQKKIPNLEYYSERTFVHLIEKVIYYKK